MKTATFTLYGNESFRSQVSEADLDYEVLRDARRVAQAFTNSPILTESPENFAAGMKLALCYLHLVFRSDRAWIHEHVVERRNWKSFDLSTLRTRIITAPIFEAFEPFLKCSHQYYLTQAFMSIVMSRDSIITPRLHQFLDKALEEYLWIFIQDGVVRVNYTEELARVLTLITQEEINHA